LNKKGVKINPLKPYDFGLKISEDSNALQSMDQWWITYDDDLCVNVDTIFVIICPN
jgi:hypothetical protein